MNWKNLAVILSEELKHFLKSGNHSMFDCVHEKGRFAKDVEIIGIRTSRQKLFVLLSNCTLIRVYIQFSKARPPSKYSPAALARPTRLLGLA
jgi:hypothetical protein